MSAGSDDLLGMKRRIARRDFLQGLALGAGGLVAAHAGFGAQLASAAGPPYPPALTGLRGAHEGSFEIAHRMRDRVLDEALEHAVDSGEAYDLVVVGGGISGLAAAYYFRQQKGPRARVLVLDNHDDFGGHAKRNEFRHEGRLIVGYGGSQSIDGPKKYGAIARRLLSDLGIRTERFYQAFDQKLYASLGLEPAVFFDAGSFGRDHLAVGLGARPWAELLAGTPLSPRAREDLRRLAEERVDYFPGASAEETRARLKKTSYAAFLRGPARAGEEVVRFLQAFTHDFWGLGIDAISALECKRAGYPGFKGVSGAAGDEGAGEPYIFHFPDGNASIARLLVRALQPQAVPGSSMEDIVTAPVDYAALDLPSSPVRIRLNSTAIRVQHRGREANAREIEVAYASGNAVRLVRAKTCVLACWSSVIPYLCPALPQSQRHALADCVKVPLVYTNVLLRHWRSFKALGTNDVYAPGGYYAQVQLDFPVSLGRYRCPRHPDEPIVVHMMRAPCHPGLPPKDQFRRGRAELLSTSFAAIERQTRAQLARILGPGGFDPAADILAITVNRWPHGYSYEHNSLFDPDLPESQRPFVHGRQRFGRIAIANSDAGGSAYAQAAIEQAHRAVNEILPLAS